MRKLSFSKYLTAKNFFTTISVTSFLFVASFAFARPLHIIHTNDLHSHLEHSQDPALGSYAAVKSTIDRLQTEARAQGIESVVLDAGDFTEGSQFYLSRHGEPVWRAMNAMGYDAVVIGNHDWLTGPVELDRALSEVPPNFAFLGANFFYHPDRKNIAQHLRPATELERAGLKIAVLGLTTNEFVYSWRNDDGLIYDPIGEARARLPELRKHNDLVIALTHLGVDKDKDLVQRTDGIDLVVGGHSHTILHKPEYAFSRGGVTTPIVQAGEHGEFVGSLLVDVEPGKPLQVLRYELIPVHSSETQDQEVASVVRDARAALESEYGSAWLHEIVGTTEVPLVRQTEANHPTAWSQFAADAMKESSGADLSLDVPDFHGAVQVHGPVTREQLFQLYPRVFEFENRFGWTIWTARVKGEVIKLVLSEAVKLGYPFTASGVTYDLNFRNGKVTGIRNIRIRGKKIRWYQSYTLALPEGFGRGAISIGQYHLSTLLKALILVKNHDTRIPIWRALEDKLRVQGAIRAPTQAVRP